MKKLIAISIFSFLSGTMAFGQQEITKKCGTDEAMEVAFKLYPELRDSYEAHMLLENSKSYNGKGMEKSITYTIPVVFHILHEYGSENLDDSQIYDAMRVINEEFNAADPDSVNVAPEYAGLIGNGNIEFKLASKDPYGNCTNGINHIYSHETRAGDNNSKVNQWNRAKYLNIWVAIVIGSPGAAAYSQMPVATDGFGFWYDGVISNHTYVGSTGTSAPGREHVLTHEIGHYLNLAHVWGSTNDPTVACGDDGVTDTPVTKGHNICPSYPTGWVDCGQQVLIDSLHSYTFDSITPTSGMVDSTPVPDPVISPADLTGITFNSFTAVGVGTNPTTTGTFGFDGWDTGALDGETVYSNLTGSINTAKYYEFTITADTRNRMTLDSLTFDVARDATGPRTYSVRWSVDGYANNIALTGASANPNITTELVDDVFFYNQDNTNFESGTSIDLSGTEFLSSVPVTFRIYAWNAEDAAGDFIVDNVFINGGFVAVEDIQNYMEYSYCNYHYTPGQVQRMHNALEGIAGQRNILWQDSTLISTGVKDLLLPQVPTNDLANLTVPLCAPVADFSSNTKQICMGENVSFQDASWNAVIGSRSWTFQDGSPSTSTTANPVVSFTSPGYKTVTLSVTNQAGTSVESRTAYIYVSPLWADYSGPYSNNLESGSANWFIVNNPEDNYAKFQLSNGTGYSNSRSYKLNNYKNVANADLFNDDYFYNSRLGLGKDELITPSYDLRYTSNVTVSFKYSYATNATQVDQIVENLKVYASIDCGKNWLPRNITLDGSPVGNSLTGGNIVTGGFAGYTDYAPTSNNDWKTATFTYNPSATLSDHVRFKFVFEASDVASNLYIDDINVDGTLNIVSDEMALLDLTVFPNPTTNGTAINVSYTAQNEPVTFTLRDTQGKIISTEVIEATNTLVNHTLKGTENLGAACYFIEVKAGDHVTTKKVIVL